MQTKRSPFINDIVINVKTLKYRHKGMHMFIVAKSERTIVAIKANIPQEWL